VLFRRQGPVSIGYIPCGPTLAGNHAAAFPRMQAALDAVCRDERALTLIMEPNQRFQLPGTYKRHGLVKWRTPFQPRSVMVLPVDSDDAMLARMHHKTRYHIRLAQRNGISLESQPVIPATIDFFYGLYRETVERNGIPLLPPDYFVDLLDAFGDHAEIIFAMSDGGPAAGVLLVRYGEEANYLFAGSSKQNRGQGAGAALVFRGLQWARAHGCRTLDLGNIGSPGLRDFKSGFGGEALSYPAAMERRYHPLLALGVRRFLATKSF
jgi:lipid II:glycine glycyltransferase (peptidoglycan interpeptide bridge formation enzyme)